jgi:RimJ/RimL family protein N-acetyltransferase
MSLPSLENPVRCLPRTFSTKTGLRCELQILPADAGQRLIDMYLAFQPRNCFQGLPPIKDTVCINWVQDMLRTGVNLTAVSTAEKGTGPICAQHPDGRSGKLDQSPFPRIVGHTALFPINRQKCEMLVVVCPGFQNVGIGTELVRGCIDLADEMGFERIWLPVDATNVRARHVYRKCGFEYVSNSQGREMDMACEVRRWRRTTIAPPLASCPSVPLGEPVSR